MIIFLYGEDAYSSRQKTKEIIEKYKGKHKSGLNFYQLIFGEKGLEELKKITETNSMFKEKKLIYLECVFNSSAEEQKNLTEYLKKSQVAGDSEVMLIIYEKDSPDKRTELFKFLNKKPNVFQEFKNLEGAKLENWIKKEVEKKGGGIEAKEVGILAMFVGGNLWQMENEIEKLVLFCGQRTISEKEIELLVKAKITNNIFNTVDALSGRDKKKILKLLHQHLKEGENELYLMAMFIRQFRNLLVIKDLLEKGVSYYELPGRTKLHPFVIRKTYEQTKNFSLEGLKKIYIKLQNLDISIKSGRIDARTALDLLVMGI
jgi:DNA polymerase-3 subunit delta